MPEPRSDAPDPTAGRLAALERQVAALSAELAARHPRPDARADQQGQDYDRRALLRRAGAVLVAGVA
ncbi:MAG: hypothetical protein JWN08_2881, partial [Frankiales bacterium]|nr:hypothetical protein [Frankiales bacterium]